MHRRPVTLCGRNLGVPAHVCAFFDSESEQYETLLPYFKEGLDNGERIVSVLDGARHPAHFGRMREAGLPVDAAIEKEQLKVMSSAETYLKGGAFAVETMFGILVEALEGARASSFSAVRTCGEMEWAIHGLGTTDALMEYEARVNALLPKYDCTLMCIYDINRFSGRAVMDVLSTHSHVVLNGKVHENPYFMEPLDFMKNLLRRAPGSLARGVS